MDTTKNLLDLKRLLDAGILTQEEYEAKKAVLLNKIYGEEIMASDKKEDNKTTTHETLPCIPKGKNIVQTSDIPTDPIQADRNTITHPIHDEENQGNEQKTAQTLNNLISDVKEAKGLSKKKILIT